MEHVEVHQQEEMFSDEKICEGHTINVLGQVLLLEGNTLVVDNATSLATAETTRSGKTSRPTSLISCIRYQPHLKNRSKRDDAKIGGNVESIIGPIQTGPNFSEKKGRLR